VPGTDDVVRVEEMIREQKPGQGERKAVRTRPGCALLS
jgi:hypothetical protein